MNRRKTSSSIRSRRAAVGLIVFMMASAGIWWSLSRQPRFYSSPFSERPWAKVQFEQYIDPKSNPSYAVPAEPKPFGPASVIRHADRAEIRYDAERRDYDRFVFDQVLRANAEGVVDLPSGGRIRLAEVQSLMFDAERNLVKSDSAIKRVYTEREIAEGPMLYLKLAAEDCEVHWWSARLYDAITFSSSSGGGLAGGPTQKQPTFRRSLGRFHDGPMLFGVDVAVGPVQEIPLPLEPGEQKVMDGRFRIQMIDVIPKASKIDDHGEGHESHYFDPDAPQHSFALVRLAPQEANSVLLLRIYRKDGTWEEEGFGWAGSQLALGVFYSLTKEDIDRVVLRYYPNRYRLLFELPGIPGPLLADHSEMRNLFESHIPYVEIRNSSEFRRLIEGSTQLDWKGSMPEFPKAYFPKTYTDTNPDELLQEVSPYLEPGHRLRIDPKTWELESTESLPWYRRLQDWIAAGFP